MVVNEADMSFKRRAEAVYDFLALGDGDRVLDMGCGRGFYLNFTRRLAPGADVIGAELDLPLLFTARSRVLGSRLVNANAYRLPFNNESFDKIIFSEVIEHVPDDAAALAELYRVLRPGGIVAVTAPHANYPLFWDPINKVLEATIGRPIRRGPLAGIWANHERLYTPDALARVASDAGFVVAEMRFYTHYAFPFLHNLVYGIGKPLLERGALPESMARAADRFESDGVSGAWWNPVRIGLAAFNAVDRLNDLDPPRPDRSFLQLAAKLVKPLGAKRNG
jgi:ubiquinone/menaquinone biosynthesis C-methylase UbiE